MERIVVLSKLKRFIKGNIIFIILITVGVSILAYPHVSKLYYRVGANLKIKEFNETKDKMNDKEIKEKLDFERKYNRTLVGGNSKLEDPYTSENSNKWMEKKDEKLSNKDKEPSNTVGYSLNQGENISEQKLKKIRRRYLKMVKDEENLGFIEIPKINERLPIYAGTSEDVLQKGVGQLEGTSLPTGGIGTHTVLTGHSGLPNAKIFTDLNKLRVGDVFFVNNIKERLAYKVDRKVVVLPTEFKDLLIDKDEDYVTLLTCTPLMVNTHRLLVRGHRIDYVEGRRENKPNVFWILIIAVLLGFAIFNYLFFKSGKKKKSGN